MGRKLVLVVVVALVALFLQVNFSPAPAAVSLPQAVNLEQSSSASGTSTTVTIYYVNARLSRNVAWTTVASYSSAVYGKQTAHTNATMYAAYLRTLKYQTQVFSKTF